MTEAGARARELVQTAGAISLKGKRVLLLVPAVTYRATDFIVAANQLELDLVIGSDGALSLGGNPVVRVDPEDLGGSVARLRSTVGVVDTVVAVDTQMLLLAASLAAKLGLPHNPVNAVAAAADKAQQRRLWAKAGVPQPGFRILPAKADKRHLVEAAQAPGFPAVVKPVSLSGSRGVLRADDEANLAAAVTEIRSILAETDRVDQEPILIEEYVPGWELSVDGLLTSGTLAVTAIFDKPDTPEGPTFEETLLVTPSRLPEPTLAAVRSLAERAAQALGLRQGPIHAELRIDNRTGDPTPVILELAARSIGGLCSRSLHFPGGMSLEMMILLNSFGHDARPLQSAGAAGVLMLPVERVGILKEVDGREDALAVPGITGLSITIPLGETVRPLPWGDRYLGFIFAEGTEPAQLEDALRAARQKLRITIV
jgi:biotin carboxylase